MQWIFSPGFLNKHHILEWLLGLKWLECLGNAFEELSLVPLYGHLEEDVFWVVTPAASKRTRELYLYVGQDRRTIKTKGLGKY